MVPEFDRFVGLQRDGEAGGDVVLQLVEVRQGVRFALGGAGGAGQFGDVGAENSHLSRRGFHFEILRWRCFCETWDAHPGVICLLYTSDAADE